MNPREEADARLGGLYEARALAFFRARVRALA
jgi:hypothetical protein